MKKEVTYPLVPGKAIGAQRGFASTFNWMRDFCLNLSGGPGVTVDRTDSDHPVIRLEESTGIAPFAVRLHKTESDQTGLWEIYLPDGCCNVGGACEPLNPPASDTSGHEDDDPAWRSLGRIDLDSFDYTGSVPKAHAVVEVHVKPSVKVFGVDSLDNTIARRVIWASVRDQNMDDYWRERPNYWLSERLHRDKPGDVFEADVAAITATLSSEGGERSVSISILPLRTTPIDAAVPQGTGVSGFDLVWVLATEQRAGALASGLALVVKMLLCIRQTAAAAGISITGDTMTDVVSNVRSSAVKIYARIDVTDLTGGEQIVKVLKDPEDVYTSSPYVVWLPLYETMFNAVISDYRSQSLTNLQLFHA